MKVRLLAVARQELDDAVAWYNDGETLVIVAVAHLHREPRYGVSRL